MFIEKDKKKVDALKKSETLNDKGEKDAKDEN